jgi:FAD synthetase
MLSQTSALPGKTQHKTRREQIAFSFNGGKDSTVLLHLVRLALHQEALASNSSGDGAVDGDDDGAAAANGDAVTATTSTPTKSAAATSTPDSGLGGVASFYFARPDDFPAVAAFVAASDAAYRLAVESLPDADFKAGLERYVSRRGVAAILLGTRR